MSSANESAEVTNVSLWNELQNIKIKLIKIEEGFDKWSSEMENIRQGILAAIEEYEAGVLEEEQSNGKN